ncbi:hypothetical protein DXG01_003179 [Tephrocybe rancida]|nr:hypothetical protein DXG01_003179 [Tephrocybe rancida]
MPITPIGTGPSFHKHVTHHFYPDSACDVALEPASTTYYVNQDDDQSYSPPLEPVRVKVRPRPREDAYAFLTPDTDESWSTLPPKKKAKTGGAKTTIRTGKFRLPRLNRSTNASAAVQKSGMEATSARRVITFLPPPLKSAAAQVTNKQAPVVAAEARAAYPSPNSSTVMPSSSPTQKAVKEGSTGYISPPSSDLPITTTPNENAEPSPNLTHEGTDDVHTPVDLLSITQRYPGMKAAWRERRRQSEEVWDLLGLPSCGRVYCDEPSPIITGSDEVCSGEIGIVLYRNEG